MASRKKALGAITMMDQGVHQVPSTRRPSSVPEPISSRTTAMISSTNE